MRFRKRLVDLSVLAAFGVSGGMLAEWMRAPLAADAAPRKSKVVKAQEFRLTDLTGRTRGAFVLGSTGQPRMDLYGTDGRLRTSIFLSEDGEHPVVALSDVSSGASPELQARIVLGTQDAGVPRLYIADTTGTVRADLGVASGPGSSGAFLKLYDVLGAEQVGLTSRSDGVSQFTMNDTDALSLTPASRVRLFSAVGGKAGLEVHGSTSPITPEPASAVLAAGPGDGPRLEFAEPSLRDIPDAAFRVAFGFPAGMNDGSYIEEESLPFYPGGFGSNPNLFWFTTRNSQGLYDFVFRSLESPPSCYSYLEFAGYRPR